MTFKLGLVVSLFMFFSSYIFAQEAPDYIFDKNTAYSICYKINDWNVSLIEEAIVRGVNRVGDKNFLVFSPRSFVLKEKDTGLIMMSSVIAIFPTDQAKAQGKMFCKPAKDCSDGNPRFDERKKDKDSRIKSVWP